MRAQPEKRVIERAPRATSILGSQIWRWLVVALFGLHGLVHLMGFTSVWDLGQNAGVSRVPAFPAGMTAGSPAVLALGVLWLVAMVAFLAAAVGVARQAAWSRAVAAGAAGLSLLLCAAWWNEALVGVIVNIVILAGLAVQAWATHTRQPKGSLT